MPVNKPYTTPGPTGHRPAGQTQRPQREATPFGAALDAARKGEAVDVSKLDGNGCRNLVQRLINEALAKPDAPAMAEALNAVFAVAKVAGTVEVKNQRTGETYRVNLVSLALNAEALGKAIFSGSGVGLADLEMVGLAERKTGKNAQGKATAWAEYHCGLKALTAGAQGLRQTGLVDAAKILEGHLRNVANKQLLAEARRNASATKDAPAAETPAGGDELPAEATGDSGTVVNPS